MRTRRGVARLYRLLDDYEVDAIRFGPLSAEEGERQTSLKDEFLFPMEVLLQLRPEQFRVLDHAWSGRDSNGEAVVLEFGSVRIGDVEFEDYLRVEDQFVNVASSIFHMSGSRFLAQVSHPLSATGQDSVQRFFSADDQRLVAELMAELQPNRSNIIESRHLHLLRVLMRLGMREVAMNTFVFPGVDLWLVNHWDMRQILFSARADVWQQVNTISETFHLTIRPLPSP